MDVTDPTPRQVLELQLTDTDVGDVKLRNYLYALLDALWTQASDFSGKRPLGNSDWQWRAYDAMHLAGWVEGERDDDDELSSVDIVRADALICTAAGALLNGDSDPDEPIVILDEDPRTPTGGLNWDEA